MAEHKDWYKLDLSAIVYPTLQRKDFSSVYRLSVLMKEEVDPDVLQMALDRTLPRFPTYKAAIRKGFFWRYLEPNNRPGPFVMPDVKNPCQPMSFKDNNRYLVRVYYYGRKAQYILRSRTRCWPGRPWRCAGSRRACRRRP